MAKKFEKIWNMKWTNNPMIRAEIDEFSFFLYFIRLSVNSMDQIDMLVDMFIW